MGSDTLRCAELVSESIHNELHAGPSRDGAPDIQYFFSDLPTNDFNTLFQQLQDWKPRVADEGKLQLYPAAVPGSFFERLFPSGSLHVVISTSALHYLSQVLYTIKRSGLV